MGYTIKHTITLLLIILAVAFSGTSCKSFKKMTINHKQKKDMRVRAKEQKKKDKEAQKAYQQAVKRNAEGQTRKTRKEMKKNYKKSERLRTGKKEFFLKRWFKRKPRRGGRSPSS